MRLAVLVATAMCLGLAAGGCAASGPAVPAGDASTPGVVGNVSAGPGAASVPVETGVRGRVTTAAGAPVAGATVTRVPIDPPGPVTLEAGVTDADGRYFWALKPGVWEVSIEMPGHKPATQRVTVVAGKWSALDFVLQPAQ